MTRFVLAGAAAVAAALVWAPGASGGFGAIDVVDDAFDPEGFNAGLGSAIVSWEWGTVLNAHNVRQDNKLFRSGPLTDDDDASFGPIELPAGRYHFYCENHGSPSGGMDGEIAITPDVDVDPGVARVFWKQDGDLVVGDRFDVRFRVDGGDWKTWFKNTAKAQARFGANDKPANFNPNRLYEVSVKTKLASNPKRRSRFSPPVAFGKPN